MSTSGREKVNGEGEGGKIYWRYFVFMCDNRTMKSYGIVLRRKGRWGKMTEGVNLDKIYGKFICKFHNVSPLHS
jgi:hypothetical protein